MENFANELGKQNQTQLVAKLEQQCRELTCLNEFALIVEHPHVSWEDVCHQFVDLLPKAYLQPKVVGCRLLINGKQFLSKEYRHSLKSITSDITLGGENLGNLEISFEEDQADNQPVPNLVGNGLGDSAPNFVAAVIQRLSRAIERLWLEKQRDEEKRKLEEANVALKNLVSARDEEKQTAKENIALNIERNIMPLLEEIKKTEGINQIKVAHLENNLRNLTSDFYRRMVCLKYNLTPTEIEVCRLIHAGYPGKKIAEVLGVAYETVRSHKKNIRRKLELNNTQANLKTILDQLF